MARSAFAAFGGCCSALLCVCWGSFRCRVSGVSMPNSFAVCLPPNFRGFLPLRARSAVPVCGNGGAACRSLPPIMVVGLSQFQLGGTKGTGYFCTCLQMCKLTCHWCLLGLLWRECDALFLFRIVDCRGASRFRSSF